MPELDPWWTQAFDRIAQRGEPERIEYEVASLGRRFEVFAHPRGPDRLSVLYEDITDRKRAEHLLRDSEERQAFPLRLSDALRPLDDPEAIKLAAVDVLGRHLGANRVAYAENVEDDACFVVSRNYVDGVSEVVGRFRYGDYGPDIVEELRAGRTRVQSDIARDERLSDAEKQALRAADVGASLNVPLVKQGRLAGFWG